MDPSETARWEPKCLGATRSVSDQWANRVFGGLGATRLRVTSRDRGSLAMSQVVELLPFSRRTMLPQLKTSNAFSGNHSTLKSQVEGIFEKDTVVNLFPPLVGG